MRTPDTNPSFVESSAELPPELEKITRLMEEEAITQDDKKIAERAKQTLELFYQRARDSYMNIRGKPFLRTEMVEGQKVYPLPVAYTENYYPGQETRLVFSEAYQQRLLVKLGACKYLNTSETDEVGKTLEELYVRGHNPAASDRAFENKKWINYHSRKEGGFGVAQGIMKVSFVGDERYEETKYDNEYGLAGVEIQGMVPNSYSEEGKISGVNNNYYWENKGVFTRRDESRMLRLFMHEEAVKSWFDAKKVE